MPEREGTVDDRLRVSLLDRNTILIDQLRLARLRVKHRHAHERRLPPALAVGDQRRRHLLGSEVRRQEGIIRKGARFTERLWLVTNIPAVHPHRVAATAVVLLRHHEAVESRLLTGRGLIHVLGRRRFGNQPEHKGHHRLALLGIERELRHPVPFVVALVFGLLVVVRPRRPELLPQESLPLMAQEFLQVIAGVGVECLGVDRRPIVYRSIGEVRRQRVFVATRGSGAVPV